MIREDDLDQAIAECQAEQEPNAWTAIRLAAFYIIKGQMFGNAGRLPDPDAFASMARGYALAAAPQTPADTTEAEVAYTSKTDFGRAIKGKPAADIWPIIDEIMSILQTLSPQIYAAAMRKIE